MEVYFRLMGHARADLLALVEGLPDEMLDRQQDAESWTIRRILRHVGNAEEWYVSRLAPPETLPAEWEHDDELPVFEFLAMERRTAVDRLRRLTAEERDGGRLPYPLDQPPRRAVDGAQGAAPRRRARAGAYGQIQEILS